MVTLFLSEVKNIYIELIKHHISREQADRWAFSFIQKNEQNELSFNPPEDEKKIWEGLMFLYGIDLQESPGVYLHSEEDILEVFETKFK